jgi:hypothetical protein
MEGLGRRSIVDPVSISEGFVGIGFLVKQHHQQIAPSRGIPCAGE